MSTSASSAASGGGPPSDSQGPVVDRGSTMVAALWVEASICIIVIVLRFWARRMTRSIGLDDWSMLVAATCVVVCAVVVTWMASLGSFRHLQDVPVQNLSLTGLGSFLFQTFDIVGVFSSKFSVGYLILRLAPANMIWLRRSIWAVILFTVLHNVAAAILNWFTCTPSAKLWNPYIPGTCWSNNAKLGWIYTGLTLNIVADFFLALAPAPMVFKLKRKMRTRIRVYILLSLSLLATLCAIFKAVEISTFYGVTDFTWAAFDLFIWAISEVFVIVVCGSVAPINQLLDRYFFKSPDNSTAGYKASGSRGIRSGTLGAGSYKMFGTTELVDDDQQHIINPAGAIYSLHSAVSKDQEDQRSSPTGSKL